MRPAPAASAATTLADRHHEIETPEHVAFGFELAGPGSRFAAFFYDALVITGVVFAIFLSLLLLFVLGVPRPAAGVLLGITVIAAFLVLWGYFVWFEAYRQGQTPGKRRLGIRVVHDGGYPLTLRGAAIRNLIRIIDVQPFPSCIIGGAFLLLHPRAQRLGDMAAATIVVRERAIGSLPEEAERLGPPQLTDEEYDVLRQYVQRRDTLEPAPRQRIARSLVTHFAQYLPPRGVGGHLLDPRNEKHADGVLVTVYAAESGRRAHSGVSAGSGSPAAAALLRRQRERWADYNALLARTREARLTALPEAEVSRFAALYREIAADLARARTYGASRELLYTLERAVAAGHNVLYSPARGSLRGLWRWATAGFPALLRRRALPVLAAALLFFGPAVWCFAAVALEPGRARMLVPAEMIARAEEGAERQRQGTGYAEVPEFLMPLFSSQIITNNVQVSFMAFAGGILGGLGTALVLLFNGILLGGVAGLFHTEDLNFYLWSFVLPHGVIELAAICIAGGAGLWMGSAMVLPGRQTRRVALVQRSREAVSLLGGTVMMLVIAGIIEGFISPSTLPGEAKLAFGAFTAVVLAAYVARAGSDAEAEAQEPR